METEDLVRAFFQNQKIQEVQIRTGSAQPIMAFTTLPNAYRQMSFSSETDLEVLEWENRQENIEAKKECDRNISIFQPAHLVFIILVCIWAINRKREKEKAPPSPYRSALEMESSLVTAAGFAQIRSRERLPNL